MRENTEIPKLVILHLILPWNIFGGLHGVTPIYRLSRPPSALLNPHFPRVWRCPNLPGGPNLVPTSGGGWGHEKTFKNKGVPNLTLWSQPFAIHSCEKTKNVGNMHFYMKRAGPPLGTPRLGPHLIKYLANNDNTLSQPPERLGPRAPRLGQKRLAAEHVAKSR